MHKMGGDLLISNLGLRLKPSSASGECLSGLEASYGDAGANYGAAGADPRLIWVVGTPWWLSFG